MKNDVYRVTAAFFLTFGFAPAMAHAQGGGGLFFGGVPGGGGGAIAGGGWQAGGLPGAGNPAGIGIAPGIGGNAPRWIGGPPGGMNGFNGGMPATATSWSNAHPYPWYNGHWHHHWNGNGFGGYRTFPMLPPLSAVLTSNSAPSSPWDRYGTGSGMGGYAGGNYPLGWGQGGWGMGSPWYNSGYVAYYNPYNDPGVTTTFNYGRPIPVPTGAKVADTDNPAVGLAIDNFRAGDYAKALALVEGVIRIQPYDAAAHELRGLILFATKRYTAAAATVHSVLAIGPGWDWTTLSSLYSDMNMYMSQLTALEGYVDLHPRDASARFLLAYHYITAGHTDVAKEQLEQVVALVPSDKLAAELLQMIDRDTAAVPPGNAPAAGQPNVQAPALDAKPVNPAALFGKWHAKRDDGTVELELRADGKFTWKMTRAGPPQAGLVAGSGFATGSFTLHNATLTLNGAPNEGSMVAQVSIEGGNSFTFKPLGGPPNDPGLTFIK
ncbi:MAG TPA: tetratricopeptide repeat protein [Pirellulales bacterium]|nr:tetratricopeptide repeat protein [Pirellulales bacterium]